MVHGVMASSRVVMRLHDYTINLHGTTVKAAGVGMVAVGLVHKKQKVAKDLISYFLQWARDEGMPIAMLYPFRPDFYHDMGFGWGTKANHYQIRPVAFPRGSREHIRMLDASDAAAVHGCYQRYYERTHGMVARDAEHFKRMLESPKQRVVGVERDGALEGYIVWTFESSHPGNDMINDMQVSELVYENSAALSELCAFLQTQSDQINRVVLHSQDAYLHHLLKDPRNTSGNFTTMSHEINAQGIGLMYRLTDLSSFFRVLADHSFGDQTCTVRFTLADSFLPEMAGSTTVRFVEGRPEVDTNAAHDVEIRLDCTHAVELLMGVIPFKFLDRYGLVETSDRGYIETLQRMFAVDEPPICMTYF